MAVDPELIAAIKTLAENEGMTVEQVLNLTWEEIAALRDRAQARADEANARIAWAEAGLAVLDGPAGRSCIRCRYHLDPSTDTDTHEICIDPERVEVDPALAELARCPDCRSSEIIIAPNVDEDGQAGVFVVVSHDATCPTLARRVREAS